MEIKGVASKTAPVRTRKPKSHAVTYYKQLQIVNFE